MKKSIYQNKFTPPQLAQKLLTYFLRHDLAEEVQGDLEEKFLIMCNDQSLLKARLNYWYQVIQYLRPFAIKKTRSPFLNHYTMFTNYCKIGWRSMLKQKMYAVIKMGGFALGIAACLLMTIYMYHEMRYDLHYEHGDQLYRVVEVFNNKGEIQRGVHLPPPLGPSLKQDYPEVEEVGRLNTVPLFGAGTNEIRRDDVLENTFETGFTYADPSILSILELPLVYGNIQTALKAPNTIVITKRKADKFFGGKDPIGKLMIVGNDSKNPFTVSGVIADPLPNSHFQFDFLMTLSGKEFRPGEQNDWLTSNYHTYIKVRPGTDPVALGKKFHSLGEKYYLPVLEKDGFPDAKNAIKQLSYTLQPVKDIYLNKLEIGDSLNHGDIRFIWLSAIIAVFILIIACINFINLSTAKSANRAKEVGLRKVVGSQRMSLIQQFLIESLLYSVISFVIALALAKLLLPYFNSLAGKTLVFPWQVWWFIPAIIFAAVIIGILAGVYPSFYLSAFRPSQVLKGNLALGSKSAYMRSALVIFQFATSIILIIGTFIIDRQMQFILNAKLGYDKEQVMIIQGANVLGDQMTTFKNTLLQQSNIRHVTISDYLPVQGTKRNTNGFWNQGRKGTDLHVSAQFWQGDYDYLKTLGVKIIAGRDFSSAAATDSTAIIINQTMARELNLQDPIGKVILNYRDWNIIGVMEDFQFESLKSNIEPLAIVLSEKASTISVKMNAEDVAKTIGMVTQTWKQFAPHQPIRYNFLDERYARMYDDVQRMGRIFTTFSVLAVIVACLGLFALSSFMVEQRSREISIRLVLGASVNSIFRLLTQNFIRLVLISFVVATPIAWFLMQQWLEDYVYKTEITADIFVIAGLIAMIIALLTISYQSIRAAFINPVEKLKTE